MNLVFFLSVFLIYFPPITPLHYSFVVGLIFPCCGYHFFDVIWENVGKSVEVVVVRESSAAHLNLKLFVDETSPDKVNR